jgi:hypothetical protein
VSLDDALVEALTAIEPCLGDVVLAGGWVPRVYAAIQAPLDQGGLLTTRDIDVAVPRRLGVRTRTIGELLEAAGFTCELGSVETLPVMHFVARRDEPDEVEIEFITAAAGSNDGPLEVQRGLTAQAVKFGHLLLEHTWYASLHELTDGRMGEGGAGVRSSWHVGGCGADQMDRRAGGTDSRQADRPGVALHVGPRIRSVRGSSVRQVHASPALCPLEYRAR